MEDKRAEESVEEKVCARQIEEIIFEHNAANLSKFIIKYIKKSWFIFKLEERSYKVPRKQNTTKKIFFLLQHKRNKRVKCMNS